MSERENTLTLHRMVYNAVLLLSIVYIEDFCVKYRSDTDRNKNCCESHAMAMIMNQSHLKMN